MAEVLLSPGIAMQETDQSAVAARPVVAGAALVGPTVKGRVLVPTRVTSYAEYVRTFGTTFETTVYSGSNGQPVQQEFFTSIAAKHYFEQGGESLLVTRVACDAAFTNATSTLIKASGSSTEASIPFKLYTLGEGEIFNSATGSTFTEYIYNTASVDERKDGSLTMGSSENYRFNIANVNEANGTFSLIIRRGDDTAKDQAIVETWHNLSLDPNSSNYIAAVLGDQKAFYNGTNPADPFIDVSGNYTNKSAVVRVEVLRPTPNYLATDGVTINTDSEGVSYKTYLPQVQEGAFFGATGKVGFPYSGSASTSGSAAEAAYFDKITAATKYPQSVLVADYQKALALLENTEEYSINVVSAPGLLGSNMAEGVSSLVSLAENRGDCVAPVDLVHFGSEAASAAEAGAQQNSSYAAAYWPWLQVYSSNNRLVWVPASVVVPGVYAYNDLQAAPWYVPAGMLRGSIQGVVQAEKKLTKSMRDLLYQNNVNPIATLPGSGLVVYGQKTLQKKASALDRLNVRRLLIEVKSKVREMAAGLLFEQNTAALQNSFRARLDPYLASVVTRNGLYAYRIDLSGNTNDAIDRNEFHCTVLLQPTRAIEYVYLNFTITATGVDFE